MDLPLYPVHVNVMLHPNFDRFHVVLVDVVDIMKGFVGADVELGLRGHVVAKRESTSCMEHGCLQTVRATRIT